MYSLWAIFFRRHHVSSKEIWDNYSKGKQTYNQLAEKYKCSTRTIRRKIDFHKIEIPKKIPRKVVILMDTTYWGANFGVMLFKDSITKENLLKYYVKYETNALYKKGIRELESKGFDVLAIVCDGRRGLIVSFANIPVQMLSISLSSNYKAIHNEESSTACLY